MITEEWDADFDTDTPNANQLIDIETLSPAIGINLSPRRKYTRKGVLEPREEEQLPAIFEMHHFPYENEGNHFCPVDSPSEPAVVTMGEMRWHISLKPWTRSLWEAALECGAAVLYPSRKSTEEH
jgi:hypothetical protein